MKPLVVALVAVIIWAGLLTGAVIYQYQLLLNSEVNIGVLDKNQKVLETELDQTKRLLARSRGSQVADHTRERSLETVVAAIVDVLKSVVASSSMDHPSVLKIDPKRDTVRLNINCIQTGECVGN